MGGRCFDSFVIVDASAASVPRRGADSIWIACHDVRGMRRPHREPVLVNPATRAAAFRVLHSLLAARTDRRVLLGVDLPLGAPAGLTAALRGDRWDHLWQVLADRLHDDERNRNDRFEVADELNARLGPGPGPFWGCPPRAATAALQPRRVHTFPYPTPVGDVAEFRCTEARLRANGRRPFPIWQLLGVGSVGSQMLVWLPVLQRLRADPELGDRLRVWPFETGGEPRPAEGDGRAAPVVLAEVWPSLFPLDLGRHPVKDAAQVLGTAEHLADLDAAGHLAARFDPELTDAEREVVTREEGWILGVT